MRDRGIHIREGFPCFLTTSHTDDDIAKIVQAFEDSIVEMVEADLLTAGTSAAIQPQANPSAPASRQASMTDLNSRSGYRINSVKRLHAATIRLLYRSYARSCE